MKLIITENPKGLHFSLEVRGLKFTEVLGNDEARELGLTTRRKMRAYALANFRETIIAQIESQVGRGHAVFARIGFNVEMLKSYFGTGLVVLVVGAFGLGSLFAPKEEAPKIVPPTPIAKWTTERIVEWCSTPQVETSERIGQIYDRIREERSNVGIVKAIVQARIGSRSHNLAQRVHVVAARRYLLSWTRDEIAAAITTQAANHGLTVAQVAQRYEEIFQQ